MANISVPKPRGIHVFNPMQLQLDSHSDSQETRSLSPTAVESTSQNASQEWDMSQLEHDFASSDAIDATTQSDGEDIIQEIEEVIQFFS